MKKIIAAALSILVGAFGYTIVDSTIESRITTIESELVDLKLEFSNHNHTKQPVQNNQESYQPGHTFENSNSLKSKFMLRVYDNGKIEYIKPSDLKYYESTTTNPYESNSYPFVSNSYPDGTSYIYSDETIARTSKNDDNTNISFETTTEAITVAFTTAPFTTLPSTDNYEDYFLYLTDVSAQITEITQAGSPTHYYDDDYSLVSEYPKSTITVVVKYKGHTDPVFADRKIHFATSLHGNIHSFCAIGTSLTTSNNIIKPDGTFECSETIKISPMFSSTSVVLGLIDDFDVSSIQIT